MKNVIMFKEGQDSFILWVKKRIKNNLNFIGLLSGETGVGKSYNGLSMAYKLDLEFSISQVSFTLLETMKILNSDWFKKKKLKVVLFDEAQVEISNRDWQSRINKLMNFLLSTFRHQNIIFIFTTPFEDDIDVKTRKLLHCIFECKGWDSKTKLSLVRPKLQQYNPKMKKFYSHSLYVLKDKKMNKLVDWYLTKPPQHLIEEYEAKKTAFTSKLNLDIMNELQKADDKKNTDYKKPLTEKQLQVMELLAEHNGNFKEVVDILKTSHVSVYQHHDLARKKGYNWQDFKKNLPIS